jgi:hypothetical protein
MSNIIIDDLLNDEDRICVPDHLIQLIKDNLEVVSVTTYKLRSNCSKYEYTEDDLNYTKDHINQLIDDILIANLDKVKHLDNRIYKFFRPHGIYFETPSNFIWLVKDEKLFKVVVTDVCSNLEEACDKEYDYILTEYVFLNIVDTNKTSMFNNDVNFLKFGGQYLDKFFETEDEGLTYINEQKWTN